MTTENVQRNDHISSRQIYSARQIRATDLLEMRMRTPEALSVVFLAATRQTNQSFVIRCRAVSQELAHRGYETKCVQSNPFLYGMPNPLAQINLWKKTLAVCPDILILHRSSGFVDYEMIKKIKKEGLKTKVIFDYDDALFAESGLQAFLLHSHLKKVLSMSNAVTAGSHYLREYASELNEKVILLPSAVDTELFNPKIRSVNESDVVTLGWLGGGSRWALPHLRILRDPLNALARKYDFRFKMVSALSSAVRKEFTHTEFEVDFGLDHWAPIEQVPALISDFDIGLMPLRDDEWSRGKCAMKLLNYMSIGLPVVASAVGENKYVISQGLDGYLVSSPEAWVERIEGLIVEPQLRKYLGENGHNKVKQAYSLPVVVDQLEHDIAELADVV
jgi:glycosyltransferase involved in cell wall biosynthesis